MMRIFSGFAKSTLAELAAQTPASRDRYVDFLRAFSITVVVVGHWISVVVVWGHGSLNVLSAVGLISGTWVTTWVLQVMPLFFFVGGFSNLVTLDSFKRQGKSTWTFLRTRAVRLLKPTGVFLGIWLAIFLFLIFVFKGNTGPARGVILVLAPLWFLVVYLMVTLAAPVMRELHRRHGVWVPVILAALAVLIDVVRFRLNVPTVRWMNIAFVWFFAHQLGFFYGDGSLLRMPRLAHLAMTVGGLVGLVVLTNIGVYPKSMVGTGLGDLCELLGLDPSKVYAETVVGTGLEQVSNMNPPTVCIVVLTCWLVGAAMLLRNSLNRWLERRRPWIVVITANTMIMSLYLWHLTAFVIAFLLLFPVGLGRQAPGSLFWWLERLVWIIVPGMILAILLGFVGRFERPARSNR